MERDRKWGGFGGSGWVEWGGWSFVTTKFCGCSVRLPKEFRPLNMKEAGVVEFGDIMYRA